MIVMRTEFSMLGVIALVSAGILGTAGSAVAADGPDSPLDETGDGLLQLVSMSPGSYLGLGVAEMNADRTKALKLKEEYGVEVTILQESSPAAKAGIRKGDVVLSYNGERIEGTEQFIRLVRETPPGRQVKLLVSRNGKTQTITVTTGSRRNHSAEGFFAIPQFEMPVIPHFQLPDIPTSLIAWRSPMLGIEAEHIDAQLAAYFGVKEGVLVRSVTAGTAAEKAGLSAGDVILQIGETRVTTPREITSAIRSLASRRSIPILLTRDHKEITLTASVEDDPNGGSFGGHRIRSRNVVFPGDTHI